jgi:hypothetical protein
MYSNEMRDTHSVKTATIVNRAHHLRRRMRDIRDPEQREAGEAFQQESSGPSFLLFRRLGFTRRMNENSQRGATFWFVLGAWLLLAAVICAAVAMALHWKPL